MRGRDRRRGADCTPRKGARRAVDRRRADEARGTGLKARAALGIALGLGWGAAGCAKFQTARECGAFVSAIQTWKSQAPKPVASAPAPAPSPAAAADESRALAERYDDLAKRIDDLALTSPELTPRAARYQELSRSVASALRDVADAVEKGEAARARQRRIEFDDLSRGEAPLVDEINRVCR